MFATNSFFFVPLSENNIIKFLGEMILSLDNINLSDSEYKWYPLKRRHQLNKFLGDLNLKKSWPHLDSINRETGA